MAQDGYHQTFIRLRSHTTGEWLAHKDLRPRLVKEATETETNLTEVVLRILAKRYSVPYEPTGRKTAPAKNGEELNLRLPIPLKTAIGAEANVIGCTLQEQVRADLCDHYGLTMPGAAATAA